MIKRTMTVESSMPPHRGAPEEAIKGTDYIYTSNDLHLKIFGKRAKDVPALPWCRKVVKIHSKATGLTIYRKWRGVPLFVDSKGILFIDDQGKYALVKDRNHNTVDLELSEGSRIGFYWNDFQQDFRVSLRWSIISFIIGFLLSLLIFVIGEIKSDTVEPQVVEKMSCIELTPTDPVQFVPSKKEEQLCVRNRLNE